MPKLNKSYPFNDIDCVNKVNEMARIPKDSWLFLFKYITKNKSRAIERRQCAELYYSEGII